MVHVDVALGAQLPCRSDARSFPLWGGGVPAEGLRLRSRAHTPGWADQGLTVPPVILTMKLFGSGESRSRPALSPSCPGTADRASREFPEQKRSGVNGCKKVG